ncbi:type IV pilus assembly protein PilQ [Vibrio brasiliensis LMG 20546]|uniref:Type IV pilus assembly protein PilQ n=1 Tax=Vibrio brasiliensis LMG 20546 TaxID=945543 RepID=E8LYX8_9VIBR|nr:type IV pilus assembly protein PilQ [Vibrio brasiliensis LMG 20546]
MRAKAFIMVVLSCVVSNSLANQSPSLPPPSITLSQTEPRSKATQRDPFSLPSPESEKAQANEKKIPLIKTSDQSLVAELTSELITLKYAQVSDLVELIDGANMLSERGLINADERTNTMLVRDLPIYINAVKQIVRSLDVAVKQVQIEARIVTVDEGQLEELGVRWGLNQNNNSRNRIAGGIEVNNLDQSSLDDRLNVNLGATSVNAASVAFRLATLGSDVLLDLELSAMQTEAKAEVISRPKLMTTNKQAAYIEQGSEIPYFESSENGASSVAFKKAVLSLKVTPQILSDDRLILDLSVTQDRPGNVVKTGSGEAVAINTQRIDTQVLVNNGQTVVLGGIYQHSVTDAVDKVPLFGDLPLIGSLFRRSYQNIAKSELLIFVTPTIVTE